LVLDCHATHRIRFFAPHLCGSEVLCKFLCHSICCVIMEQTVLGIDPVFWPEEGAAPDAGPDVLPMTRPG
jgi:hypothetical protein